MGDFQLIDKLIQACIDSQMNGALVASPLEDEIDKAVLSMNSEGAASPDGFNGMFYEACWNVIKCDFVAAVNFFLLVMLCPKLGLVSLLLLYRRLIALQPLGICVLSIYAILM